MRPAKGGIVSYYPEQVKQEEGRKFYRGVVAILLLVFALFVVIDAFKPAKAQETPNFPCDAQDKVTPYLEATYGETRAAFGIAVDGQVLEVFTAPSGSWTIFATDKKKMSCHVASGGEWRHILAGTLSTTVETTRAFGRARNGALVLIKVMPDNSTWSMEVQSDSITNVLVRGEHWEEPPKGTHS